MTTAAISGAIAAWAVAIIVIALQLAQALGFKSIAPKQHPRHLRHDGSDQHLEGLRFGEGGAVHHFDERISR